MKKYVVILLIIVNWNSYSCDCPPINEKTYLKEALKYYDIIFYGDLVKYDTIRNTFYVNIIEIFKGNYNIKHIKGISANNNCARLPTHKGLWLIFAKMKRDTISIDGCNPSYFYGAKAGMCPLYIYRNLLGKNKTTISKIDSIESKLDLVNQKLEAVENWNTDLEQLRRYRKENSPINTNNSQGSKDNWLMALASLNLFLIMLLVFYYFKHKK